VCIDGNQPQLQLPQASTQGRGGALEQRLLVVCPRASGCYLLLADPLALDDPPTAPLHTRPALVLMTQQQRQRRTLLHPQSHRHTLDTDTYDRHTFDIDTYIASEPSRLL
jgi:hypothetical protein